MFHSQNITGAGIATVDEKIFGQMRLKTEALVAFAPDDMAQMNHALEIARQADRMEVGIRKLEQAFFTSALADRATASRVDVHAALVPPVAAEWLFELPSATLEAT